MIGKWANINGKFTRVVLDKTETKNVMKKLLEFNINEIGRVIKTLNDEGYNANEHVFMVKMLSKKQMISSYTALLNALEEKITNMKTNSFCAKPKKDDKEFKALVEKQLDKLKKEKPKSKIEEAFDDDNDYVEMSSEKE